jgi:hypothetical protein
MMPDMRPFLQAESRCMPRRSQLLFGVIALAAALVGCSSGRTVDMTDFAAMKQLAIDHGLTCAPDRTEAAVPQGRCVDLQSGTTLEFTIGPGFDGVAGWTTSHGGTCPAEQKGLPGWIWAGNGYWISLFPGGENPTSTDQAIKDELGGDVWCQFG